MNKRIGIFVLLLFLYLFCTFETMSLTEKGIDLNSLEQHSKVYENHHKTHEKQSKLTEKPKNPKILKKIKKKKKILEDDIRQLLMLKKIIANKTYLNTPHIKHL